MAGLAGPAALLSMKEEIAALEAAGGGGGAALTVQEKEGITVPNVTTINVTDGTLSLDAPGEVTIDIAGGGGSAAKTGFSPVNLGSSDTSFAFDVNSLWGVIFLTKVEETMSLDNITIYGTGQEVQPDPADGDIEIMIYNWGTGWNSAGSTKKCGGSLATCGYGPNEIALSAEVGEDLLVEAGENIMIAIRKVSGTFDAVAASCRSEKMYTQRPFAEEGSPTVDFPTLTPDTDPSNPTWEPAGYAPACTLWEITA